MSQTACFALRYQSLSRHRGSGQTPLQRDSSGLCAKPHPLDFTPASLLFSPLTHHSHLLLGYSAVMPPAWQKLFTSSPYLLSYLLPLQPNPELLLLPSSIPLLQFPSYPSTQAFTPQPHWTPLWRSAGASTLLNMMVSSQAPFDLMSQQHLTVQITPSWQALLLTSAFQDFTLSCLFLPCS